MMFEVYYRRNEPNEREWHINEIDGYDLRAFIEMLFKYTDETVVFRIKKLEEKKK